MNPADPVNPDPSLFKVPLRARLFALPCSLKVSLLESRFSQALRGCEDDPFGIVKILRASMSREMTFLILLRVKCSKKCRIT